MKQNERELIVQILDGDEQLYGVLIDRYKEGLYRHCFRIMRDEYVAEDVAQEAFIKAYVKLASFDRVHAFSTWLYKIATNIALGELRRKRPGLLDEKVLELLPGESNATDLARYSELYCAIERLPEKHKQAIKLHYFKGKKYEQIAEEMDTSIGSIKAWTSRAKKQLKEMLS